MPKLKLRRFLYLDGNLTNEFLAQVEGGLYDEESRAQPGVQNEALKAVSEQVLSALVVHSAALTRRSVLERCVRQRRAPLAA
jgi:hypothetical protein